MSPIDAQSQCLWAGLGRCPPCTRSDAKGNERIARIGRGTPNPRACVAALRERGKAFAEAPAVHSDERGALTCVQLGSFALELVRDAAR